MAKRRNSWTEEKIARYIKEGRGKGELSEYIPWLKIQDFSTNGNASRFVGWKTKRQHEFLSNLERDLFLLLEWEPSVIDIREQFPLNREETISIAEAKGIKHSINNITDTFIVMTTDFFVTVNQGDHIEYIARTVKPSESLEDKRVVEKFEIEREYWMSKGINWGIVTEKELPKNFSRNILWAHKYFYLDDKEDEKYALIFLNILTNKRGNDENLLDVCNQFDADYNIEIGSALSYIRHFVARKLISVDMEEIITASNLTIKELKMNVSGVDYFDYIGS
ncbi:TnsA endonuclease N-terminal domain-containing protein [Sporosarcina beigongshangi]|uniref:TnsA endonuclease N-terminal domain-containing protein n=1 Tax=Sporosarcina beigongshangi TaxID=2782538 RepID=UPI001939DEC4|nr:TnsA endonuclease N-terminal domain-containing protein [Sporosarcina beigongshangi]